MKKLTVEKAQQMLDELRNMEHAHGLSLRAEYYVQALEAFTNVEWVKCSDRMPEHNQQVLTWNGQYKATDLCLSGRFLCIKPNLVTHWMPLPEAPL